MLTSLFIKNFALIDQLNVEFNSGLTIITGETGAGKSILLGGLALVLGKRADLSQIKNKDEKCIVEATFDVANYNLEGVYSNLDMDYDVLTIVRREILPSGKSRAFVNDTPVTLDSLSKLSSFLIDIHSQHQTQQLISDTYQFKVIDALCDNDKLLNDYRVKLNSWKALTIELEALQASRSNLIKEYDYNMFLLNELEQMDLDTLDLVELEDEFQTLSNVETIQEKLAYAQAMLSSENHGTLDQLQDLKIQLNAISGYGQIYEVLANRVESVAIELNDILADIDNSSSQLVADPKALELVNQKLQWLNTLLHKHNVADIEELKTIKSELQEKIEYTNNYDSRIESALKSQESLKTELVALAKTISNKRKAALPHLIERLESILIDLGMPNAKFKVEISEVDGFKANGSDDIKFLFTANKGGHFKPLKNVASGGEQSRIMLALKSILAVYVKLPSIMFDEIDTGVSGEIAKKMGDIMQQMSRDMQVFAITHLPQIAAKGHSHFKVFKSDTSGTTHTDLKRLTEEDRLVEIAQMLGGLDVTESAIAHAKQLLN